MLENDRSRLVVFKHKTELPAVKQRWWIGCASDVVPDFELPFAVSIFAYERVQRLLRLIVKFAAGLRECERVDQKSRGAFLREDIERSSALLCTESQRVGDPIR